MWLKLQPIYKAQTLFMQLHNFYTMTEHMYDPNKATFFIMSSQIISELIYLGSKIFFFELSPCGNANLSGVLDDLKHWTGQKANVINRHSCIWGSIDILNYCFICLKNCICPMFLDLRLLWSYVCRIKSLDSAIQQWMQFCNFPWLWYSLRSRCSSTSL